MVLANEILQWLTLSFCAVFLFGLTRQLGFFLMPRREELATHGPSLGKRLSEELLPAEDQQRLQQLSRERRSDFVGYVVIYDKCASCENLIQEVRDPLTRRIPVAALAVGSDPEFQRRALDTFDVVVLDPLGEIRQQAEIIATPFVILLDANLNVVAKEVTDSLVEVADAYTRAVADVTQEPALTVP